MKIRKKKSETELDKEIKAVLERLSEMDPVDDEYRKTCDALTRLIDIKNCQEKMKRSVSPDTIAIIAANLLGIALILGYEQGHVITSKAFSMISKLRF